MTPATIILAVLAIIAAVALVAIGVGIYAYIAAHGAAKRAAADRRSPEKPA